MIEWRHILSIILATVAFRCVADSMSVVIEDSMVRDDETVKLIRLGNSKGMVVRVCNYAAALTDVMVPDRHGVPGHVVLGFDSIDSYFGRHPKFGATVGRYANRIRNARFALDGQVYHLDQNNKGHCIHGGNGGFNRQVFGIDTVYVVMDTAVVAFTYMSPDQDNGFPGNMDVKIEYRLTDENELILNYTAMTDRPTVVNLTNHSYFNLSGGESDVLDHSFMIRADSVVAVDKSGVPTGEIVPVNSTAYDLLQPRNVRDYIEATGSTYDVCYVLDKPGSDLGLASVVADSLSGRMLRAYTTEPGMQFYIPASNLDYVVGHDGRRYGRYYGFCLEMQHFPDSLNHSGFPSTVLMPGEVYRQTTVYKFETIPD